MLTPSETNINATTCEGTLKMSINKLPDGRYQVDASFFDNDGYYVAHKSSTRIVNTFNELLIS